MPSRSSPALSYIPKELDGLGMVSGRIFRGWLRHIKKVDTPTYACGPAEETGFHLVCECPRHEEIQGEFLVGKSSLELDKVDWRKVEQGEDAWYFQAVEEFFGHLYGAMTCRSASSRRGELTPRAGNSNRARVSLA